MSPIRLFIGCSPNGEDAECQAVCEYTLRKFASRPIDITWMILSRDPSSPFSGWQTDRYSTPFSPFRWAVPWLCGFKGKAIYMDDDVIVRADIAELWDQEFEAGRAVIGKDAGRLCVSVWDCERAKDFVLPIDRLRDVSGHAAMRATMTANRARIQPFKGGDWNCLDGGKFASIDDPAIKLLHLTSMPHNPAVPHAVRRLAARGARHWFDGTLTPHFRPEIITLFDRLLLEADRAGFPVSRYDPGEDFGPYKKNCLKSLIGAKPSWAA